MLDLRAVSFIPEESALPVPTEQSADGPQGRSGRRSLEKYLLPLRGHEGDDVSLALIYNIRVNYYTVNKEV
jgi:hypothetical protein